MKDDTFAHLLGYCMIATMSLVFGVILGGIWTDERVVNEATKSTTIFCVEKPKECKIRYDYYNLEEKTK